MALHPAYKIILVNFCCTIISLSTIAQTEYIVTVDPANAAITKIDSIPGVTWLKGYYMPTYCETIHRYTFTGGDDAGGNPFYLFTVDAVTGRTLYDPLFANHNDFSSCQYATSGNILYAIYWKSPTSSLVTVDPATASYSILRSIPNMTVVSKFIVDEQHNRFIIVGPDNLGKLMLATMDISSGNIISQVYTPRINNLLYNKQTGKCYAIANRTPPSGGQYIYSLCSVDINSGTITNLADIANIAVFIGGNETLDENGGRYFFSATEWNDTTTYLYSIDITNGKLLNRVAIPQGGGIASDNLIEFRYDNILNKLYALFWEAKTIKTPPVEIDSACRISLTTKIYPNPSTSMLIVNKNATICKVTMNLYNSLGQLVIKDRIINDGHNEIKLMQLASGVYYYSFVSGNNMLLSGKLVKQ
ncbi:T9SS type A sorting domain-containing protein [Ferruginibacter sp.]